ncbi:MAG: hypothetical protein A3B31_00380 [Candidatus Komeilibacteria bacterium RIFCSPLOWO2_01_FULL_53_11]|uniref:O-antigen ligase-related domain-containing protein n=1 Tax=Candidatus Komeilibacteria bacterium RIFCSPLOWO2_01_FULL_53_11 TaxID=1798552 RepID=A0A1G2BVA2_9BACT|nr:MAG: hypothetical protein A3B31_00380 [Candidatus Komeilibacteria bacterium RIFCSPLOWO2_01_FULL_53_11]
MHEVLSLAAYTYPVVNMLVLAFAAGGFAFLFMRDLRWSMILGIAELAWGSFGSSFSWHLGSFSLSLRMLLFGLSVLFFAYHTARTRRFQPLRSTESMLFIVLALITGWGFIQGIIQGQPLVSVFLDGNAYVFILYFLIWRSVFHASDIPFIGSVLVAAAIGLSIKTLLLFNFFANGYELANLTYLYIWVRDTRIGEITYAGGNVWRIFIQSQLYIGLALLFSLAQAIRIVRLRWVDAALLTLYVAAIIVSLSRSFWIGIVVCTVVLLFAVRRSLVSRTRDFLKVLLKLLGVFAASVVLVLLLVLLPFGGRGVGASLIDRIGAEDPSGMSRIQMLGPLASAIMEHPILGSGFGKEVTYQSSDPRFKNPLNPDGTITTFAFEWGYLDQWLKLGAIAGTLFVAVLIALHVRGWQLVQKKIDDATFVWFFLLGLLFIELVHIVSPYLNHPLGLGYLVFGMVLIEHYSKRVYEKVDH